MRPPPKLESLRWIGVPSIFSDPLDANAYLVETLAIRRATAWYESGASLLVLAGSVGSGKSLAAASVLCRHHRETSTRNEFGRGVYSKDPAWLSASSVVRLAPWGDEIATFDRTPFLVIDDLGEEEPTTKAIAMLTTLITQRTTDGQRTIVTTNASGEQFRERYNQRVTDRLREGGLDAEGKALWWVWCGEASLRGRVRPQWRLG